MKKERFSVVKVKICGVTNVDDALHAADCGADMLGFNFYEKSPRYLEPSAARAIASKLPDRIEKVGVFVNMDGSRIAEFVDLIGLTAVQLHGDEDERFVDDLRRRMDVHLIKAVRVDDTFQAESVSKFRVDAVLLDTYSTGQYGGTGNQFDWNSAIEAKAYAPAIYLAGGLTPENVADAIRTVRPHAVDTASGVESSPGKKDSKKVADFIRIAKNA